MAVHHWFRKIVDRDSGNLGNPFMRVTNWMMGHLATSRESQILPAFARACFNFITLTFRALGRHMYNMCTYIYIYTHIDICNHNDTSLSLSIYIYI